MCLSSSCNNCRQFVLLALLCMLRDSAAAAVAAAATASFRCTYTATSGRAPICFLRLFQQQAQQFCCCREAGRLVRLVTPFVLDWLKMEQCEQQQLQQQLQRLLLLPFVVDIYSSTNSSSSTSSECTAAEQCCCSCSTRWLYTAGPTRPLVCESLEPVLLQQPWWTAADSNSSSRMLLMHNTFYSPAFSA